MPDSALDRTTDRRNNPASLLAGQRTGQVLPLHPQNSAPSTSTATTEQQADPAIPLVAVLSLALENTSDSAALKYEHNKAKAKATHQANLNKKAGDLSKVFPAFAETSIKARKDTEKDLAILDQRLVEHQKTQRDLLSVLPELLQALKTSTQTEKEREQMDMVRRCMSVYEVFKSNVDDVKQRFEKHQSAAAKREQDYQSMENKIESSASQLEDLLLQMGSIQDRCFEVDGKHNGLDDAMRLFRGETTKSLAAMEIDLKQFSDHDKQHKGAIEAAVEQIDATSQRLELLQMKIQTISDSETMHAGKLEELEKLTEGHSNELQKNQAVTSHNKHLGDAVKLMKEEIEELRQTLTAVQEKSLNIPGFQELSTLQTDIAALREDVIEYKNDKVKSQNADQTGQKLLSTNTAQGTLHNDNDMSHETHIYSAELKNQLQTCVEDIAIIQERLKDKQIEEEERDDIVAARVDDVRASIEKVQKESGRRLDDLEIDMLKQRTEDLNKMQKVRDSFSQLLKAADQNSTTQISPPSASPTPQLHQMRQPQASSSSPRPLVPVFLAELTRRLDNVESLLSETKEQLQAVTIAYQQLDQRYNNLSTEQVVRAMVHQMQSMYPFASEAQREIINLKQMVEPLRNIPVQLDSLKRIADNHSGFFTGIEARIDNLDEEKTKNEVKQEKLVEYVREERGKLVDEVSIQKATVNTLGERLGLLEEYRDAEPDKFEYLLETLAKKLQAESTKAIERINQRLDVLETDSSRQNILETFTGKPSRSKTASNIRDLLEVDDTDDSAVPLALKTNRMNFRAQTLSAPAGLGRSFLKPRANLKKRKRFGSPENNDRSDDDTYAPKVRSSPTRRRQRG